MASRHASAAPHDVKGIDCDENDGDDDDVHAVETMTFEAAASTSLVSRRKLALAAAAAAVGGSDAVGSSFVFGGAPGQSNNRAMALVDSANAQAVFEASKTSVVGLADYVEGGANGGYTSRGTGVVWSELGYVVTNFHVIAAHLPSTSPSPNGNGKGNGGDDNGGFNRNAGRGDGAIKVLRVNVPDAKMGDPVWYDAAVVGTQRASDVAVLRLAPVVSGEDPGSAGSSYQPPKLRAMPVGESAGLGPTPAARHKHPFALFFAQLGLTRPVSRRREWMNKPRLRANGA